MGEQNARHLAYLRPVENAGEPTIHRFEIARIAGAQPRDATSWQEQIS